MYNVIQHTIHLSKLDRVHYVELDQLVYRVFTLFPAQIVISCELLYSKYVQQMIEQSSRYRWVLVYISQGI